MWLVTNFITNSLSGKCQSMSIVIYFIIHVVDMDVVRGQGWVVFILKNTLSFIKQYSCQTADMPSEYLIGHHWHFNRQCRTPWVDVWRFIRWWGSKQSNLTVFRTLCFSGSCWRLVIYFDDFYCLKTFC